MIKKLPLLFSVGAIVVGMLTMTASMTFAKVEYTKKEKKPCITCHAKAAPKAESKDLNDVGKCYETKKDLKACVK